MKKFLIMAVFMIAVTACNTADDKAKNPTESKSALSKTYFVKGMTCGGCILGVKTALKKADSLNILGEDITVGKAVLQFDKKTTDKTKLNCNVAKAIEGSTEFTVFLDEGHTQPACKS